MKKNLNPTHIGGANLESQNRYLSYGPRSPKFGLLLVYLLFLVVVFLDSCETGDEANPVATAQQWFNQNIASQEWDAWPLGTTAQSVNWQSAVYVGGVIEVPVALTGSVTARLYDGNEGMDEEPLVRLILWQEGPSYSAAVVRFLHEGGNVPSHMHDMRASGFSGVVLINRGDGKKYAALFNEGERQGEKIETSGRTNTTYCYTICDRLTISAGGSSRTQFYCDNYCYSVMDWQIPQMGEGDWVFDLGSVSGGSSTGPWTQALPNGPSDGDIFELLDPSGVITVYIYNAATTTWEILVINVPAVVVTAQNYPFLANIPTDFSVTGPDNFLYNYSETLASWIGTPSKKICPENFNFVSVTTNNLWQEAAIANAYVKFVYSGTAFVNIRVNLPTLYFGLPHHNINGVLVYSPYEAADIAVEVYNDAEKALVEYFKQNPYLTEAHYQNYWLGRMQYYMDIYTAGLGRVGTTGSLNPANPVVPANFVPCTP